MDYEKKYKEALERARKELNTCSSQDCDAARQIFRLFPELKESEDEKIRKAILNHLKRMWGNCKDDVCGVHVEDAIAWLEKQGKQKPIDYNEELKKCRENPSYFIDNYVKLEEKKSAWSEEDQNILEDIEEAVINYWHGDTVDMITSWLKRRIK